MPDPVKLSFVLPCYNEAGNINFIYAELIRVCDDIKNISPEFIFIDDGSRDGTFEKIRKLAEADKRVKGLSFSKNFGKTMAIYAGLKESTGDLVISMDSDGQHPASLIPVLLEKHSEGYEIVNTRREQSKGAGFFRRMRSRNFYRLINFLSDVKVEPLASDFRLMTRKAVDAFLSLEERDRYTNGLVSWMGFRQISVQFTAPERNAGITSFSVRMLLRLGLDGITSFSARPLRISFTLGMIILFFDLAYGIYAILNYFFGTTTPGWTSMMFTILFLGGVQLITIGIIGEYIARLFNESKKRPHFFIQDRC
ncbi:glycosyltransferase family 2 protein [Bacteroidota bacterium]